MKEALPLLIGCCFGTAAFLRGGSARRVALGSAGAALAAFAAVLASGEYRESWAYLLLDLAEAAAGFAAGIMGTALGRRWLTGSAPPTR